MAELNTLRKHIINYAKTREVYVAYRKAGYSKKFLAEHEEDILLHKAAKKAFDDMGIKKLPTVKSIQAEYVGLLAEKKKLVCLFYVTNNRLSNFILILQFYLKKNHHFPCI